MIANNLMRILEQIKHCHQATSPPTQLIAVSKTKPVDDIAQAINAGQRHFGENYLQEAVEKIAHFRAHEDLTWHFIGAIQSNKTRAIAQHFDWVHAVDRIKIARRLSEHRLEINLPPLNICLAVNIDNEPSKFGFTENDVTEAAIEISTFDGIHLRGLMCIPAPRSTDKHLPFAKLCALRDALNTKGLNLDTLSMGMSNDYCEAIAEGATFVRIGTQIFGARE